MKNKLGFILMAIAVYATSVYAASFTTDGICLRSGSNKVCLISGTLSSNLNFTLPTADGTNGQALKTDGAGALSFGDVAAGGGDGTNYTTNPSCTDTRMTLQMQILSLHVTRPHR